MSFVHTTATRHPELVISYCASCGELVAGSSKQALISTVESLHHCTRKLEVPAQSYLLKAWAERAPKNLH